MSDDLKHAFLSGDSVMAGLMRSQDWSGSPLGDPAGWPQPLRSVVNLMLGSAFPMFVAWGPQLAQLYNDPYMEIMGAKHPAGLGRPLLENWAEIRDSVGPLAEQAMHGVSRYLENMPLRMQRGRGDGEDTWFTFSYSPVQDESGAVAGMFCACIETTQAVLAERELRAREEWLRTLFDQAPGFAAVLRGPEHVFERANDAYRQLTGHRDLIGKTVAQALPEVVGVGFIDWLDGVFNTGQPFVGRAVPVTMSHGPGRPPQAHFVDFIYQPLRGTDGKVEGIFVQGYDVTEQHRAREALRDADRQKDEFLATLAHELRNPLAPIRTAAQLLVSPAATEQAKARATGIIGRQVGQMSRLLDDLIDIARITQRRLLLKKETVQVGAVVEAALEAARPQADAEHHVVTTSVADPALRFVADPVRITQVLSNLLNNACKFTDPGGRITLAVDSADGRLAFTVADNGIGLSGGAIDKLFVMFGQEQSALQRSEGGLGIGLALAKGLVDLHGGTVRAESAGPGLGSRFIVELPLADSTPLPAGLPGRPAAARAATRLVVLADDNRDAVDALADLLRSEGHDVHTAHDGQQALDLALRLRPDVMVLDIGMPGLNGYEVATQLRRQDWGASTLLVAATGWGQEEDRRKALAAGFDLHLTKPFDPLGLMATIAGTPAAT